MKLDRLAYDPAAVLDFYQDALGSLGALCDRTWHDRLEIVTDGRAATLFNAGGELHSAELQFAPADAAAARDASREVFPGSPLTFRLAEYLRPIPLPLERVVLASSDSEGSAPPDSAVLERLWRAQFPDTARWRLATDFKPGFHFSLLALIRCEIQAIDQHWSLHRIAVALPGGESDDSLARQIDFAEPHQNPPEPIPWPPPDPARWNDFLGAALDADLAEHLAGIRARQENSLRRELERIDDYFDQYAADLDARAKRTGSKTVRLKTADRLAAARAEHARRRGDQVARHEIRILPHLDALLMLAEPAWCAELEVHRAHRHETLPAFYVPRARRWHLQVSYGPT